MNNQPSHGEILDAVNALDAKITPLVEKQAEIGELVEILRALHVGGKGVSWLAKLVTGLLALGGVFLWLKALWDGFKVGE